MSSEWKKYTIADVSKKVITGKTPPGTLDKYFDGEVLFVTPTDMGDNKYIELTQRTLSDEGGAKLAKQKFECGIVVSCIGWQMGKAAIVRNVAVTNQQINTIIPNSDLMVTDFLYYILSNKRSEIFNLGATATRTPILKKSLFEKIEFYAPKLEQQKKIASILSCLDHKIINNQKINQTLEQMAQALFKSWFVDFEPVKAKMAVLETGGSQEDATFAAMTAISGKDTDTLAVFEREHPEQYAELKTTAELFPSAMQESELGAIPVGWNISNIKDNVDVRDGTHASPKASDSGYHLVTSKNITSGYLDRRSCYYISDMDYHEVNKRSQVSCGDILISMIGTVGALYFVAENNVDYAIKNIGLIRTSERQDLQAFIFYHLKSNNGVNYINSRLAGTTQKYLSLKQLREIPIVMPTQDVLAAFNKKIFLHEIHANQEITETLANIRDTLLPKLLSGEITLPEAEQAVSEAENV